VNGRWRALLLAPLMLWQLACAAPEAPESAAERQLLVMLPLPPPHFRPDADYSGGYAGGSAAARLRVARELARAHGLTLVTHWPMAALGIDCYVMERPVGLPAGPLVERLEQDPRVGWAQPMALFHALDGHDPLYPAQPGALLWHLAELHRVSTGRGVRVAVVDSGVELDHPDLAGQIESAENFVPGAYVAEAHGTAVAAIIAARAGNGVGIEGVAPGARLLALRACWQEEGATLCSSFTLGKALNFALLHQARVINLSLGGPPDRLLARLLDAALAGGAAVVAAVDPAGGSFPASHPGVIAVADSPAGDALVAPGRDIPSAAPGGRWDLLSGSSYSAAHVSGLLALLAALRPGHDGAALRRDLRVAGGPIDACASLSLAADACVCACPPALAVKR
jgi:hypothetical protein